MTDKELEDFIHHGETGFLAFAMMFGDGWAQQAIDIAKELRARLEQLEQEPVAWITQGGKGELWWSQSVDEQGNPNPDDVPLYTSPHSATRSADSAESFCKPKPLAWLEPEWGEQICLEVGFEHTITSDHPKDLCWIPLYTAPPQREWQGLTDEEIKAVRVACGNPLALHIEFARAIEAKLKEKNSG